MLSPSILPFDLVSVKHVSEFGAAHVVGWIEVTIAWCERVFAGVPSVTEVPCAVLVVLDIVIWLAVIGGGDN